MEGGMPDGGEVTVPEGFSTQFRPGTAPTKVLEDGTQAAEIRPETGMRPGTAPTGGEPKGLLTDLRACPAELEGICTRPSTAGSISDMHEFGQESMMNFLHLHMHSILQPFSDNLQQLHNNADSVAGNLREIMSKLDMNTSMLTEQSALIDGIRADIDKQQEQANATQLQLEAAISSTQSAQSALDSKIGKVQERIPPIQMSIKDLWQAIEDSRKKIQAKQKADLEDVKAVLDGFYAAQEKLESDHKSTVEAVDKNALLLDKSVKDIESLRNEALNLHAILDQSNKDVDSRFSKCNENLESLHEDFLKNQQAHDSAVNKLSEDLNTHSSVHEDMQGSLKALEAGLAETNTRTVENGENFSKLVRHAEEKRVSDLQKTRGLIEQLEVDVSENARKMAVKDEVEKTTAAISDKFPPIEDDVNFSFRRLKRLEKVMGLEMLKKDDPDGDADLILMNGMLLSKEQVDNFKDTFSQFDSDSSGNIEIKEIGAVLSSMGQEVTPDLLQMIAEDLDKDKSGEIRFEEFCSLMAKLLGPDGKVDMESYVKHMSNEAKQNRMLELVPVMNDELAKSKGVIKEVQSKLEGNHTPRIQSLEGDHAQLVNEVQKLRKGLELTQEYWKGFSRGMKETKRSVRQEGNGELLPNGNRLPILPPLERRPPETR